ncbi:prepilin peptidase [Deinococcus aquiradiocola]|uniref:Prepilin peptidase n=1 Tax=Deinococcus aquiradiocola TaxID=393059 RepID=A0A917PLX7_9DEIO|nr:A24 family peptidase [Deinococcus aquiradiocola]GGJ84105.1 prepilin peptidase [Deinococcus aquiradiocola]
MIPDTLVTVIVAVLGLLIGSFSNVLIWRLPRRESINFPPSHCPNCDHALAPLDLVPVLSWAALRGRCRYCRAPISPRYPVVELVTGAGYLILSLMFPYSQVGASLLGLCLLFTLLLVASVIDQETYSIPDEVSLPGAGIGLLFGLVNARTHADGLPVFAEALRGMLLGAGLLIVIDLFGSWVMRRARERSFPEAPLGYQQIALALLAGTWLGAWAGIAVGAVSVAVNLAARRAVRVPEWLTLGGTLLSLVLGTSGYGPGLILMVQGGLAAAGGMALLCGLYWWLHPIVTGQQEDDSDDYDPAAMGFGDVKLAAMIGAFLGWENLIVAVVVAIVAGAVLGVLQLLILKENRLKFGPYLALGALIALMFGAPLVEFYRRLFGL